MTFEKGDWKHPHPVQDEYLIAQNPGAEVNQLQCLMNLPEVLDKTSSSEEEMIMSMDTEEEEKEEDTTRLDQLSTSITESHDLEEYSGGLRERVRVPPVGGGGGGGMDQRSKRKIGMGNGPPPPPPKSAPPPLPIQIL